MDDLTHKRSDFAKKFDHDVCIRLYNKDGEHVLSLIACDYTYNVARREYTINADVADPDGKVLYCGMPEELIEVLADKLSIEYL